MSNLITLDLKTLLAREFGLSLLQRIELFAQFEQLGIGHHAGFVRLDHCAYHVKTLSRLMPVIRQSDKSQ